MPEIVCKATGQVIPEGDVDALADHWAFLRERRAEIEATLAQITVALWALCQGDAKTRRVRGARRRVRVESPPEGFEQSALRSLWLAYPDLAAAYLRIDRLAVNLIEYRKLANEAGTGPFESFKAELQGAYRGPVGSPRVVIEE